MSGKVNLSQYVAVNMVAAQVMMNHLGLSLAISMANFKFNVLQPLVIKHILHSMEILSDVCISFKNHLTDDNTLIPHTSTTLMDEYGIVHLLFI